MRGGGVAKQRRRMGMHEAPAACLRALAASGGRERRPVKRDLREGDESKRCDLHKRARNSCAEP